MVDCGGRGLRHSGFRFRGRDSQLRSPRRSPRRFASAVFFDGFPSFGFLPEWKTICCFLAKSPGELNSLLGTPRFSAAHGRAGDRGAGLAGAPNPAPPRVESRYGKPVWNAAMARIKRFCFFPVAFEPVCLISTADELTFRHRWGLKSLPIPWFNGERSEGSYSIPDEYPGGGFIVPNGDHQPYPNPDPPEGGREPR